ncbi:MAG: AAA family ATPase [Pseudohongiellaceae bacterium]
MTKGTLIFFCGKMGAGKSTASEKVSKDRNGILFSEDHWLATLYPSEIKDVEDYLHYSKRLKPLIETLVRNLLETGTDVVMDFPANTVNQRLWFKQLLEETGAPYKFYFLNVENTRCLSQIAKRRVEQPDRAQFDTPEVFEKVTMHFAPPSEEEGFEFTTILGSFNQDTVDK